MELNTREYKGDPQDIIGWQRKRIAELEAEVKDLQQTFMLRWNADMRAIKRWHAANPNRQDTWPDHADLVVWLMERLDQAPKVSDYIVVDPRNSQE